MIGTSSTRAGRILKFSGAFTSVLIVHDTRTDANGGTLPRHFSIPHFSRKRRKKLDILLRPS
jgi:hypothetical protein